MMKWSSDVQILYQTLSAAVQSTYNSEQPMSDVEKQSPYYGETISIFYSVKMAENEQHGYI